MLRTDATFEAPPSVKYADAGDPQLSALALLLGDLAASNYSFTTPTPLTHQRVLARTRLSGAKTLRDIFGWNLPFTAAEIQPALLAILKTAGVLRENRGVYSSTVRVSSLDQDLFLHSAFPTTQDNAVFFGPDTYRFARFIRQELQSWAISRSTKVSAQCPLRILDVGCGSGAGGIAAARCLQAAGIPFTVTMNDINPLALKYTAANAAFAGIAVELALGDALSAVTGNFDLVISNPPYLDDPAARAYRHGGARLGRALGVRIAIEALARLALRGQLVLYTGVAIVDGFDPFIAELQPHLAKAGCHAHYSEIDPDVFGEELERPVYAHADRIAAVGLVATRRERSTDA